MRRPVRTFSIALLVLAALATGLTGCRTARIGARCHTTDFGQTATQILQCKGGRWRVLMTKAQYVQLLIALKNRSTTTTTPPPAPTSTTTTTAPPAPAYAIAGGYEHSCAIIAGAVKCVGRNQYGQLGDGTTNDSTSWVSTGITDAVSVSAGVGTSCAVKADGTAWCWGWGGGGALGNGGNSDSSSPVQVPGITDAVQVESGPNGRCVRTSGGLVKCWGHGRFRGDGSSAAATTPVTASITDVTKIAVGSMAVCALKSDKTVWCWGGNDDGQLGNGTTTESYVPVQAIGVSLAVDVASGGFMSGPAGGASCAALAGGTAMCWGDDNLGLMGDGDVSTADHLTPTVVTGLSDAARISVGFYAACAVRSTGAAKCWGQGGYLGNGSSSPSTSPVDVTGVTNATAIAAVGPTACALLSTNGAKCWGTNAYGEAGSGNTDSALSPLTVVGMP